MVSVRYKVYIYDLSIKLPTCNIGCVFGSHVINHILYVDDLIVFVHLINGCNPLYNNKPNI